MKKRLALTLWLALPLSAGAGSWETAAFRTPNGQLVRPGSTMTEVLRDAGQPESKLVVSEGVNVGAFGGETKAVWTYRGSDGVYDVTFVGTRVTQLVVTPYR